MSDDSITPPVSRPGYRALVLAMLLLVYSFNFLDRQVLGILAGPIRADLHLSALQFGALGGIAFALLYATLAVPLAILADKTSRSWVITGSLVVWSGFTALCGLATGFSQLFWCRLGVGVGEAGGVAPSYAFIADSFPPRERARALAIYSLGVPLGLAAGALLGGYIAATVNWRMAFIILGVAGIVLAPIDFAIAANATAMRSRIDADRTVPARLASTLSLGGQAVGYAGGALAHTYFAASLDGALLAHLRYVVPAFFDRVMAYPELPFPLSRKLEVLAPDVFLPGVGVLPNDFIMAVQTNPRFVEALMLGANHEMGREMLWQGLPTDQRGTPLRCFWQRLDGAPDIEPIHQWNALPLGHQPGSAPMTVLLFRGRLLERYRTLTIYAYPMNAADEKGPGANEAGGGMLAARIEHPVLRGHLLADIDYVGFAIDPDLIDGWFFVVEEHMTEPRFGFDERVGNGQNSSNWQDVDWVDIDTPPGAHIALAKLRLAQPAAGWGDPHAATIALAALQRPFRGYWRGQALRMPK